MFEIYKTPRAKADLMDIWLYTFETWGETQADRYLGELDAGLERLRQDPELGKAREALRTGYRSLQINRHVAYYRLQDQRIDLVRVLHERMDPWHHLDT